MGDEPEEQAEEVQDIAEGDDVDTTPEAAAAIEASPDAEGTAEEDSTGEKSGD